MGYPNNSRRNTPGSSGSSSDPFWLIVAALLILTLFTIGLPAIIVGFFVWRYVSKLFGHHWKWSFACWFLLLLPAALLCSYFYQHGLQQMIYRQLTDVIQTAKHSQFDLTRWPFGRLWSETWPVWLRTLVAIPLVAVWQEVSTNARGGQITRMLAQGERDRQRRIARAQQYARKRALRPDHLDDETGGQMVIGVPIDGDEEQE